MPTNAEISLNPTSAKGDILSLDGLSRSRLAVGTNGTVLTSRSSTSLGVNWETLSSEQALVAISSNTVTAAVTSYDITSIPWTSYTNILINVNLTAMSGDNNGYIRMAFHSASGANTILANSIGSFLRFFNFSRTYEVYQTAAASTIANASSGKTDSLSHTNNLINIFIDDNSKRLAGISKFFGTPNTDLSSTAGAEIGYIVFSLPVVPSSVQRIVISTGDNIPAGSTIQLYGIKRKGL